MDNHGKETVPEIEGEGYGGSRGIGEKGLVSVFLRVTSLWGERNDYDVF